MKGDSPSLNGLFDHPLSPLAHPKHQADKRGIVEPLPVSVNRYESSTDSLRSALDGADAFRKLEPEKRVLIKPNLVGWDPAYPIAPYGVYTTSRLVEDMIRFLKDFGVRNITIGEGSAPRGERRTKGKDLRGTALIFKALGYPYLRKKYGVRLLDFFEEPFEEIAVDDIRLRVAREALKSDFFINMPVLKTHNQTKLSLGLKNLKGCIDLKSRKLCHNAGIPLDYFCSLFAEIIQPDLTVLDGIYGLEKGPYYLGTAHRMDVLVASQDPLAVDVMGAVVMGFNPAEVDHIALYGRRHDRSLELGLFPLTGNSPEEFARPMQWDFAWREDDSGPRAWDKLGIRGIRMPKYDQSLCTGCSALYNPLLMLLASCHTGKPFEGIEVLTGKRMEPAGGFKKTLLFGNCMIKKNLKNPRIQEAVPVKGCPVAMEEIIGRLKDMGLDPKLEFLARFRHSLAHRYDGDSAFEPDHYFMPGAEGRPSPP